MRFSSRALPGAVALALVITAPVLAAVPAQAATKHWSVAVSAPGSALANTAASVSGHISPRKSGKTVKLQKKSGSHWSTVKTGKTHASGAYSFSVTSAVLGTISYRVYASKSGSEQANTSRTFKITTKPHVAVQTQDESACALNGSGRVYCWGDDEDSELGNGTKLTSPDESSLALPVKGLSGITQISNDSDGSTTCALTSAGGVKCWGYNDDGQLGDGASGTGADRNSPVSVTGLSHGVKYVSAGYDHACALLTSGTVKCWGEGEDGELGNGHFSNSTIPVTVSGLSHVKALDAGADFTCALLTSDAVKCWGDNYYDELGNGDNSQDSTADRATPQQVAGLTSGVKQLSASSYSPCVVLNSGAVKCWGYNYYGEVGNGTSGSGTNVDAPAQVVGLTSGVKSVDVGYYHSCVILNSGSVKCWGYGYDGALGNGVTAGPIALAPVNATKAGKPKTINAGDDYTCELTTSDTVKCWGYGGDGQLGDGNFDTSANPVTVISSNSFHL